MRIYSMTATFGKLDHETLTLEPGLNILTAPNEWGKSTWCAFLVAMLYGLDTRAKTTKTALADKDRYAPWSGAPMAGRIDLCWQGRDITIERSGKRRTPLGEFRAYETATGLEIPELTAANCGQTLLGVEQSVFRRAGFLRQADLPVTQDEALRRRLNALVTTGDESGDGDRLAQGLATLKNKCRHNRTGLLPQAQAQQTQLENTLEELSDLEEKGRNLKNRLGELTAWSEALENHLLALDAAAAEADAGLVAQAGQDLRLAEDRLTTLETLCGKLPSREEARQKLRETRAFREEWNALLAEQQALPRPPLPPAQKPPFVGMDIPAALDMVRQDRQTHKQTAGSRISLALYALGAAAFLAALVLLGLANYPLAAGCAGSAALILLAALLLRSRQLKRAQALARKYGDPDPARWTDGLREYEAQCKRFHEAQRSCQLAQEDVDVRMLVLRKRKEALCGGQEPDALAEYWQQTLAKWESLDAARREAELAKSHYAALAAMAKESRKPGKPDNLTFSREETQAQLAECAQENQRLTARMGQYQGRMEALGSRQALEEELDRLKTRIAALEQTYTALTIAQETLQLARAELQRRFAPRIAQRAQELLSRLTDGRYDRLTLGENLDLQAATATEETLHDALWRSDGTIDQLYLALRLAVAEALTPEAPLILDDALVRFDDTRLKAAMDLLRQESETRQVILFTCQSREQNA